MTGSGPKTAATRGHNQPLTWTDVDNPASYRKFVFGKVCLGASRWQPQIAISELGMWTLRRKRHLRYPTLEAWFEGEHLTDPFSASADPIERNRRITEYGELRQHLFAKHIRTLLPEEQREFKEGAHPSQSHSFADRAEPFATLLREHLANLGVPSNVCLGWYHMDRIVLSADLDRGPGEGRRELPWLFRGFEIKYSWPQGGAR